MRSDKSCSTDVLQSLPAAPPWAAGGGGGEAAEPTPKADDGWFMMDAAKMDGSVGRDYERGDELRRATNRPSFLSI